MMKTKCDGQPHIVQITSLRLSEGEKRQRVSMKVSDGCHFIRAAAVLIPDLKNNDIVNITTYRIAEIRGSLVMLIEKLERVYTNIAREIGSPVEYNKENTDEHIINTEIPATAEVIGKPITKPVYTPKPTKVEPQVDRYSTSPLAETKGVKPIKALGLHSNDWTIKVRLLRRGEQKRFVKEKTGESYLAPLELIDNEGTQITATLFSSGVDKYYSILKPMSCYLISNGNVRFANKRFTSIRLDYCINLDAMSSIKEVADDPSIPRSGYTFTSIVGITGLANGTMIDIIGVVKVVSEISQFSRKDGTQTGRRMVTLYDDSGHEIEITLWGPFAEDEYYVGDILAFKSVKVSNYNGKQLNTTFETTIVKDPENPRTNDLRKYKSAGEALELIPLTQKTSFSGEISMIAEVIKTVNKQDIDPKGIICWVSGNIITINYEKGFYYVGCKKCKKKVLENLCDKCNEDGIPYYMFNMKISDGTESIWLHVFGEQGETILSKPAEECLRLQEKDNTKFRLLFEKPKGDVSFI